MRHYDFIFSVSSSIERRFWNNRYVDSYDRVWTMLIAMFFFFFALNPKHSSRWHIRFDYQNKLDVTDADLEIGADFNRYIISYRKFKQQKRFTYFMALFFFWKKKPGEKTKKIKITKWIKKKLPLNVNTLAQYTTTAEYNNRILYSKLIHF